MHLLSISDDRCCAGDGRPLARVVEEAKIDFRVGSNVISLAGLGVGVEDEVCAVVFLFETASQSQWLKDCAQRCLTFAANAIALLARRPSDATVVKRQNLDLSTKLPRSSIFSFKLGSCRFLATYGSAALEPVSVLLNDILEAERT